MEAMILECAKMDREIDVFVSIVEQVTAEVRAAGHERLLEAHLVSSQRPEAVFSLAAQVRERFTETAAGISHAELQLHQKVVAFKESQRSKGAGLVVIRCSLGLTSSSCSLTCPSASVQTCVCTCDWCPGVPDSLSVCCSCPVVGCGNTDVRQADLIPDQMLRRKIQKRSGSRT
ncbi:hypothetical protein EYF80_064978 [Liparis tanakae]|uniref:Uncharacterized protein n=1 Tax=Liparis tanakae TaxID=230148 RepID=A0A4Z2E7H9_9TELE|nr:hypothetical protein EYF80_064978 [Liparis tanakae]